MSSTSRSVESSPIITVRLSATRAITPEPVEASLARALPPARDGLARIVRHAARVLPPVLLLLYSDRPRGAGLTYLGGWLAGITAVISAVVSVS